MKRMCIDYSTTVKIRTSLDAYSLPRIDSMINSLAQYTYFSTFDLKSAYHQVPIEESDKPCAAFETNGKLYQLTRIPFMVTNGVAILQRAIDDIIYSEKLEDSFPYLDNVTVAGRTQYEYDENVKQFLKVSRNIMFTLSESKTVLSVTVINILHK